MSTPKKEQTANQQEQFISLMRGFGTRTILHEQNVATSLGLYNNDFISLDILREAGPITAGELSKKTGLTTGSITALVDRLEKKGYVYRQNDPTDRRRVIIVPNYENKDEVSHSYEALHTAMVALASSYTEEELALIMQFMGKANTVLEEQIQQLSTTRQSKTSS